MCKGIKRTQFQALQTSRSLKYWSHTCSCVVTAANTFNTKRLCVLQPISDLQIRTVKVQSPVAGFSFPPSTVCVCLPAEPAPWWEPGPEPEWLSAPHQSAGGWKWQRWQSSQFQTGPERSHRSLRAGGRRRRGAVRHRRPDHSSRRKDKSYTLVKQSVTHQHTVLKIVYSKTGICSVFNWPSLRWWGVKRDACRSRS